MERKILRDIFKSTFWLLAVSSLVLPIQFSQAADNEIQEWINTTTIWSEARKEVCGKLKKSFPFWKTMKYLWIDSEDYKYYAEYYNIVESSDKYNWKANQNYNLQLALFDNCETVPNIESIREWNYSVKENQELTDNICKKSPLYIEHGIYNEDCSFTEECEKGYNYNTWDKTCEKESVIEIKQEEKEVKQEKNNEIESKKTYTDEEIKTYQWAKENKLTTMNTIDESRFSEPLTRAELAKIMSVFAKDVLWKEYLVENSWNFLDVDSSLWDLEEYIQQAYRFQIMWTWAEWETDYFLPNAYVTRAEFATVLSRLIFWDRFNQEGENWYAQHLYILKKSKLLDNKKPQDFEIKSDVIDILYKLQGLWLFSNIIPKENPLIDKIEKLWTNWSEEKNVSEEINGSWIKLNYDGVLLHVWFSTDDYKQTLVQYAYKLWGMDFVYMIECENGNWDIGAVWDSWHAFWLCQMNDRWHKNFPEDYKTNWIVQVEYCYEKWKWWTKFYWPSRRVKWQRCYNYVKNRFLLVW